MGWIMGQPSMDYYIETEQQSIQELIPYVEVETSEDLSEEILQIAIDNGWAWYILGFAVIGASVILKKRIKKWLMN